ncbi:hypothetical protein Pmani_013350 [Petrolisthes manimaculis]|uniref:Phospholipid scramblase n=1 Tax=Petrolisthes manimaculis TaxID=1843537 RepID=A0AAE1PVW5_9EUCA|nr:hypothetical protein Pmani_013350 [Petrolisthes manimaculis]
MAEAGLLFMLEPRTDSTDLKTDATLVGCSAPLHHRWWTWVPGPAQQFPPGLEHLTDAHNLFLYKKGRRYRVMKDGLQVYSVKRFKQDGGSEVTLKIQNKAFLDVLILNRTKEAQGCCSSNKHVEVLFPPANLVGVVQGGVMEYTVHNPSGDILFLIERQEAKCNRKPGYQIVTKDGVLMGYMSRVNPGCCRGRKGMEISFPQDLEIRCKALLVAGAVSLVSKE